MPVMCSVKKYRRRPRVKSSRLSAVMVESYACWIQMRGGCQGCASADATLKQGVEVAIRNAVPKVGETLGTTDHAVGRNACYTAAGHQL